MRQTTGPVGQRPTLLVLGSRRDSFHSGAIGMWAAASSSVSMRATGSLRKRGNPASITLTIHVAGVGIDALPAYLHGLRHAPVPTNATRSPNTSDRESHG